MTTPLRCRWCDNEATTQIEVQPAQYRSTTKRDAISGERITSKEMSQRPIFADVCAAHAAIGDNQPEQIGNFRTKKAKGVEQTTIFDVPGVGPRSAIHGVER